MTGAKVNGVIVPIDKVPQNGEIIEIITSQSSKGPSRDWLKIVKTGQARSKIRQWFKKEKKTENIQLGKSEVEKEVKKLGLAYNEAQLNDIIVGVAKRIGINSADDFYNTLGFGGLSLQRFMPKIKEELEKINETLPKNAEEELSKIKLENAPKRQRARNGIVIDGENGLQIKFAKCCNPLPGDKIVGFITRGFGVSIHKTDCRNVLISRQNEENLSRWISARWEKPDSQQNGETYEAKLQIIADNAIGVIAGISMTLADMKVSITQINTQSMKDGSYAINISIECRNVSHFDAIVSRLRSVKSVNSVKRGY